MLLELGDWLQEVKYLGVLFTSDRKMEQMDRQIGAASVVMRMLTFVGKRELSHGVAWLSLREGDIRRKLGAKPPLLRIERIQQWWFEHLIRMPPGYLQLEVFWAHVQVAGNLHADPELAGATI